MPLWSPCRCGTTKLLAESNGKAGLGVTPLTTVNTRDLHSRDQQHQQGTNDKVFNNLIVESYRTDPLPVGHSDRNQDGHNDIADKTLPEIMTAAIRGTNDALHSDTLHSDANDQTAVNAAATFIDQLRQAIDEGTDS